MATSDKSDIRRNLTIIIPIVVAVVLVILIIAVLTSQKLIPCIFRRSKGPILPVTNLPPRKPFVQRHLEALRFWWKPAVPPAPQSDPQSNTTEMPTLTRPPAIRSSQRRNRLTHQEWLNRYHTRRSPREEERRRKLQEEWKPRVFTQEYTEHWKRIAEEQKKARRTLWEKMKDRMGI